jgi:signal transduction histidine kinase
MSLRLLQRLRSSIRFKIFVPTLLLLILATQLAVHQVQKSMLGWIEEGIEVQDRSSALSAVYAISAMNHLDQVQQYISVLGGNPFLDQLILLGEEEQQIVAANELHLVGSQLTDLSASWVSFTSHVISAGYEHTESPIAMRVEAGSTLFKSTKLREQQLWLVWVADPTRMEAQKRELQHVFLIARGMTVTILFLGLSLMMHLVVIHPLKKSLQHVHEHGQSIIERHDYTFAPDEIGQLAKSVHEALNNLTLERDRLKLITSRSPVVIYSCLDDQAWSMLHISDAIEGITGLKQVAFLDGSTDYNSVIHPADRDYVRISIEHAMTEARTWDIQYRVLHATDGVHHVREIGRSSGQKDGGKVILDGIIFDVTEKRRAELLTAELNQQERHRMESLQTMAGSVAHHFNNLLTVQLGQIELMGHELRDPIRQREGLESIREVAMKLADLSRLMLLYVGQSNVSFVNMKLGELLDLAKRDLQPLLNGTQVSWVCNQPGALILGNRDLATRMLAQLLQNALEAGDEPKVEVKAGRRDFRPVSLNLVESLFSINQPEYSYLEVCDTGAGMSQEVLKRAFDPFFTTRFTGRGLGLSTVLGIARSHGAMISIRSAPNVGTCLTVIFPEGKEKGEDTPPQESI